MKQYEQKGKKEAFQQILVLMQKRPKDYLVKICEFLKWFPDIGFHIENGRNLLHEAVILLDCDITEAILKKYTIQSDNVFSIIVDYQVQGLTPLCTLIVKHNGLFRQSSDVTGIIKCLISYGADKDRALLQAVEEQKLNFVRILLEQGADGDIQNKNGETPLFIAAKNEDLHVVEILLKHKAKINVKNNNGETPLFIAVINKAVKIVDILLTHINKHKEITNYSAVAEMLVDWGACIRCEEEPCLHKVIISGDYESIKATAENSSIYNVYESWRWISWAGNYDYDGKISESLCDSSAELLFSVYSSMRKIGLPSDIIFYKIIHRFGYSDLVLKVADGVQHNSKSELLLKIATFNHAFHEATGYNLPKNWLSDLLNHFVSLGANLELCAKAKAGNEEVVPIVPSAGNLAITNIDEDLQPYIDACLSGNSVAVEGTNLVLQKGNNYVIKCFNASNDKNTLEENIILTKLCQSAHSFGMEVIQEVYIVGGINDLS